MMETSLVGLEAPNPVPSNNLVDTTVDGQKFKKIDKKTTLTIVQDFPKKKNDNVPSITSYIGTALTSAKNYFKGFFGA